VYFGHAKGAGRAGIQVGARERVALASGWRWGAGEGQGSVREGSAREGSAREGGAREGGAREGGAREGGAGA
jgi:hypothetical protein